MTPEKGFLKSAFEDMKENAKKQREIDKENYAAIKADSRARFEEAKKIDLDFQEFKEAKGLKEKARVVMNHVDRDAKAIAHQNRENYKKMLEEQRERNNKNIKK